MVNLNEVWKLADEEKIATDVFSIVSFENILTALDTTEKLNMSVILMSIQTHEENNVINLDTIGSAMVPTTQRVKVPVVVHLDHGANPDYIEKSLEIGFTSVIFDGSALIYEENIRQTEEVVVLARKYGASIEAEIGEMAGITLNNGGVTENRASDHRSYTGPAEVEDSVEKTGVDCLARSFGAMHGEYLSEPKLDFELIKGLKETAGVLVVMYGGSGVSHADYGKVIVNGVRKINYSAYMDRAGGESVNAASPVKCFHDTTKTRQDAMQKDIESAMRYFVNMDQSDLMKIKVATSEINDRPSRAFMCDCGEQHTTRLEHVRVCDHVKEDILKYLQEHACYTVYVTEDENTYRVYGEEFEAYLNASGITSDRVILEADAVPDEASVLYILVNMKRQCDYILGVRSGTLNNLYKFTSYKLSLNYGIAAVVSSMNGFASVGAAPTADDLRTTYDCHVLTIIFGDLDILANAPLDMIRAGLSDIVEKHSRLVNQKIVHMTNGEYYCQVIVGMIYKPIKEVVTHVDGMMTRGKAAVKAITETLIETGMAMGFVGNSYPASGSEHHVSHYWEMKFLFAHHAPVFHGAKMGLATPGIVAMQRRLARGDIDFAAHRKHIKAFDKAAWEAMVFDRLEAAASGVLTLEEKAGKNDIEAALKRINIMEGKQPGIQAVTEQELPQPGEVITALKSIEAPYRSMQVGVDEVAIRGGMMLAKEVRVRHGLL